MIKLLLIVGSVSLAFSIFFAQRQLSHSRKERLVHQRHRPVSQQRMRRLWIVDDDNERW